MTEAVVETVSNLMASVNTNVTLTGQLSNNTASRIVQSVEAQVSLSLKENDEIRVVTSHLAIHGIHFTPSVADDNITGITFAILGNSSNDFNNNSTEIVFDKDIIEVKQLSASLSFSSQTVKSFKSKI